MNKLFGIIWRSLLVGAEYTAALVLTNLILSRNVDASHARVGKCFSSSASHR